MAEVYIVGQIIGAHNFTEPSLFLRWTFLAGMPCGLLALVSLEVAN